MGAISDKLFLQKDSLMVSFIVTNCPIDTHVQVTLCPCMATYMIQEHNYVHYCIIMWQFD